MSAIIQDAEGRLPWVCRTCRDEFWASPHGAGYGCHRCGSFNVETFMEPARWVGPTDGRLLQAVADAGRNGR